MTILSIDAVISLVVGVPSLVIAILTYWEARRTRREQVRPGAIEFEALIAREYVPPTGIMHAPTLPFTFPPASVGTLPRHHQALPTVSSNDPPASTLPQPQARAPTTPIPPRRPPQVLPQEPPVIHTSQMT